MTLINEFKVNNLSKLELLGMYVVCFFSVFFVYYGAAYIIWWDLLDIFSVAPLGILGFIGLWVFLITLQVVLHEGLHGIGFKLFGNGKVQFGFKKSRQMGLVAYASSADTKFTKRQFAIIGLLPQALTVVLLAVTLIFHLSPIVSWSMVVMAATNFGGGCIDMYGVIKVAKYPANYLIEDIQDGFRVYAPQGTEWNK
jgi:hypothetical protein